MEVTWKCPHCGTTNTDRTDTSGMNVFVCLPEDGGCDRYSVVEVRPKTVINTRIFKLEEVANG